jgi:hypothetical protein
VRLRLIAKGDVDQLTLAERNGSVPDRSSHRVPSGYFSKKRLGQPGAIPLSLLRKKPEANFLKKQMISPP